MIEKSGGGAIVNTASTSGIRYTGSPQIGYASSKAAVIQFSRVTAVQYANQRHSREHGDPGPDAYADGRSAPRQAARRRRRRGAAQVALARIPLGFMGDGRDTANAVLFLASDEARFITGTEIIVDGGMTARCD